VGRDDLIDRCSIEGRRQLHEPLATYVAFDPEHKQSAEHEGLLHPLVSLDERQKGLACASRCRRLGELIEESPSLRRRRAVRSCDEAHELLGEESVPDSCGDARALDGPANNLQVSEQTGIERLINAELKGFRQKITAARPTEPSIASPPLLSACSPIEQQRWGSRRRSSAPQHQAEASADRATDITPGRVALEPLSPGEVVLSERHLRRHGTRPRTVARWPALGSRRWP